MAFEGCSMVLTLFIACIAQVQLAANELGVGLSGSQFIWPTLPPLRSVWLSGPSAWALPTLQLQGGLGDVCNHCIKKSELLQ